jgi:hypothetical protein
MAALRAAETIGRPMAIKSFLDRIAALIRREARPAKWGPEQKGIS